MLLQLTIIFSLLSRFLWPVNGLTYKTRFDGVTWDDTNWTISTTTLDQGHYQARMSLANGYLGINVAAVGPFFESDTPVNGDDISGWPLFDRRQTFATIAGFYDSQPTTNRTNFPWISQYGGESTISGVPHWSGLLIESNGHLLDAAVDPKQISRFRSNLNIKTGVLVWTYKWSPPAGVAIDIEYSMLVHKLLVNQAAVQLKMTPASDTNVTVIDVMNGDCALRTTFVDKSFETNRSMIWSAVGPAGISNVTAYIYSVLDGDDHFDLSSRSQPTTGSYLGTNQSSIAQSVGALLKAGQTAVISKYIGGASTDAFADPNTVARNQALQGSSTGFEELLISHAEEWSIVMPTDSVDSFAFPGNDTLPDDQYLIEQQITAVTNPFGLLQNTVSENALKAANNNSRLDTYSIQVCGLGSDCYAGFIFWDAEVWMAPGLVASHPQAAKQIAKYRVEKFPQAKENVKQAFTSSQNGTLKFSDGGAAFPWTSGRFGNCTATGPCFDYEYHLNGDIGLELYNYFVTTGDIDYFKNELFPIYDAIAYFYGELLTLNESSGMYMLTNATDPDEYANHVDNPGFTMALIKTHLETANSLRERLGMPANASWTSKAQNIDLPIENNANIILEYVGMNGKISVKQADVVLVDDFLDFPNPYSISDLEYYAGKQSLNGPGMTYGVFSVVASAVSPSGCASYTYDLYGSEPYIRAPWFQYSEQLIDDYTANGGTHPAYPFLTGMGGANRVALFGYLGLRLQLDSLMVNPNLPPQIPHLKYRTFFWQGHPISAYSNSTHTTLTRLQYSLPNSNGTFNKAAIPVTIGFNSSVILLQPSGSIVIPNRRTGWNASFEGNIAQCMPVTSPQDYMPGQFPLSAVDGADFTKWQPLMSNVSSYITVELQSSQFFPITAFHLDWAQNPPSYYKVQFSNSSGFESSATVDVWSTDQISVSKPYNDSASADITPYSGNTTDHTLSSPIYSGKYARLTVQGNQDDPSGQGPGPTVAEWAILKTGGGQIVPRGV